MSAYLLALGAACCFGSATALQHRAARAVPHAGVSALRLAARLTRNRTWIVGRVADVAAVALQALALRRGSLLGVQSVVSCGILVAIGLSAAMQRRLPQRRELIGATLLVAGVALTAGLTHAGAHVDHAAVWRGLVFAVALVASGSLGFALLRSRTHLVLARPSTVLGAAAGACFATGNAFLKIAAVAAAAPLRVGLVGVAFGTFALLGLIGNVFAQRGFQLGEIGPALAALVAAEPLTALAVGTLVLHDRIATGLRGGTGTVGLSLLVVGVYVTSAVDRAGSALPRSMSEGPPSWVR